MSKLYVLGQPPAKGGVLALELVIPVLSASGWDFGAEAVQNRLWAGGWKGTTVVPMQAAKKIKVTLKRSLGEGKLQPFDEEEGRRAVAAAAAALGTKLAALKEWVTSSVRVAAEVVKDVSPAEVVRTSGKYWQEKADEIREKGFGPAFGLPGWFFPALVFLGVVGGGLFVAVQVGAARRALFGEAPESHRRKPKHVRGRDVNDNE